LIINCYGVKEKKSNETERERSLQESKFISTVQEREQFKQERKDQIKKPTEGNSSQPKEKRLKRTLYSLPFLYFWR